MTFHNIAAEWEENYNDAYHKNVLQFSDHNLVCLASPTYQFATPSKCFYEDKFRIRLYQNRLDGSDPNTTISFSFIIKRNSAFVSPF